MYDLIKSLNVGSYVHHRKGNTLGISCRPGRENHRQQVFACHSIEPERTIDHRKWQPLGRERTCDLVANSRKILHVLQINQIGSRLNIEFLHYFATSQDIAYAGLFDATVDNCIAHGVIEIHGNSSRETEGKIGDRAWDRGRYQDTDKFFVSLEHLSLKNPSKHERT